ncbi:hypothetical protein TRSC58_07553 [Trypanosoma rangeli SC58]|uniref:Uncharacterized protein n=1 Tax=Trypanosoma rangeli SC58 TaxID=429131 RepID=A0A061IV12_TRYRA|nr:hypothetical protein TRSC58_07553 [Trypanosoma rangeli SC58]
MRRAVQPQQRRRGRRKRANIKREIERVHISWRRGQESNPYQQQKTPFPSPYTVTYIIQITVKKTKKQKQTPT